MVQDEGIRSMKKAVWGIFLIALGGLFLFERFGMRGIAGIGEWWPFILIVIGITHLIERRAGSALTMILLGAWFLAVTSGWMGLTYGNSWSLVLVAVGAGIVVKALTGEECRHRHTPEARLD
jgi:hypothetical protein